MKADQLPEESGHERTKLRKRALRLMWRLQWVSKIFPPDRAATYRELGESYLTLGKPHRALRAFDKSREVAERQLETYELAQSDFVCERAELAFKPMQTRTVDGR